MAILIVYVYGALSLKYVTGAESLYQVITYMFYDSALKEEDTWVYFFAIAIFFGLSIGFSFGEIENSKVL